MQHQITTILPSFLPVISSLIIKTTYNQSLSSSIYGFLAYPDIHISVELVAVQAGDEVVVVVPGYKEGMQLVNPSLGYLDALALDGPLHRHYLDCSSSP